MIYAPVESSDAWFLWPRRNAPQLKYLPATFYMVRPDATLHNCHVRESQERIMALPKVGGAAGSILTGLTAMAMISLQLAYAHGPAEWIQRGGFKNAAGELCCGERDCFELTDADVKITSAGYYVVSIKETVPFSEATPSPDGRYWRCQWGGSRKCFFAPPSAT
jgi:hypothetical protein